MYEITDKFAEAMIPILERESNLTWGPQSVGRIVRWTCTASGGQIEAFLSEVQTMAANYAILLRRLNYLLENREGATPIEVMDLAAKMNDVSFPLQRVLDMLWPNDAHATAP